MNVLKVTTWDNICLLVFNLKSVSLHTSWSEVFVFLPRRSQSLTTAFQPNPPLSASSSKSSTRTTTGRCSWRRSTRSNSQSGRGRRKSEPWRETRCIGSLLQTVTRDLMPRSLTASRKEMKTESSLSSPRLDWCLLKSSLLLENTTFLQWVFQARASSCPQPDSLWESSKYFTTDACLLFYCCVLLFLSSFLIPCVSLPSLLTVFVFKNAVKASVQQPKC